MAPTFPQRFGSYTLHELVARGGMAEIYRATMPGIGGFEKTVAIKKILPHLAENEDFINMLIDEARIIESVSHYNIAQVYELEKIDDTYFIAMEYIHGVDLSTIIKTLARMGRYVPLDHTAYIASCICAGLYAAHSKTDDQGRPLGIVHRDISPHNVLLSYAGDVKVIDFGVAKASLKGSHTEAGVIKGKLLYMAPEQAKAGAIDGRADLFAAGLIIYKMLTNRLPFEGENEFQIYNNIMSKEIVPPKVLNPEIPDEFNAIIMKLLARDPNQRYQDGYAAKQELDRLLHRIAPGYTVNRLSRFVEDNFANIRQRSGERQDNSGSSSPQPQTPSAGHLGTGQIVDANLPYIPAEAIEDGKETVDMRAGIVAARSAAAASGPVGFPASPGGAGGPAAPAHTPLRASVTDAATGQFAIPTAEPAPPAARTGVPPAAYAVVLLVLITALAAVYAFVLDGPDAAPTADADPGTPVVQPVDPASAAPAAPAFVTIDIETVPDGASVYLQGRFVGITPYTHEAEESDEEFAFELRKSGFDARTLRVVLDADATHKIELVPVEADFDFDIDGETVDEPAAQEQPPRERPDREPAAREQPVREPPVREAVAAEQPARVQPSAPRSDSAPARPTPKPDPPAARPGTEAGSTAPAQRAAEPTTKPKSGDKPAVTTGGDTASGTDKKPTPSVPILDPFDF